MKKCKVVCIMLAGKTCTNKKHLPKDAALPEHWHAHCKHCGFKRIEYSKNEPEVN